MTSYEKAYRELLSLRLRVFRALQDLHCIDTAELREETSASIAGVSEDLQRWESALAKLTPTGAFTKYTRRREADVRREANCVLKMMRDRWAGK